MTLPKTLTDHPADAEMLAAKPNDPIDFIMGCHTAMNREQMRTALVERLGIWDAGELDFLLLCYQSMKQKH